MAPGDTNLGNLKREGLGSKPGKTRVDTNVSKGSKRYLVGPGTPVIVDAVCCFCNFYYNYFYFIVTKPAGNDDRPGEDALVTSVNQLHVGRQQACLLYYLLLNNRFQTIW